jgi:plasmid stabilization system protein ParE
VTSTLPVAFTRRAARHVDEAGRWWRENRTKAPEALHEELNRALQLVTSQPNVGAVAQNVSLVGVRRILLRRVNYHLYYRVVESPSRAVQVVALWHASRDKRPGL